MISLNGEEYLTVKEAARLLGVKPATLYAYVSRGVLRSYRQGIKRQRLYRRAEVEGLVRLAPSATRGERDPAPGARRAGPGSRSPSPGSGTDMATLRRAAFINPGRDLAGGVDLARRAEGLGYDSVWVTHGAGRDSFLVLAAYGAATTRLGLGNGVVPIYPRHPVAMAQAALTLSELTGGRFTLGMGVSHRASMEAMLGLALREPLAVMREYVAVLRGALGGSAAFEGRALSRHVEPRRARASPGAADLSGRAVPEHAGARRRDRRRRRALALLAGLRA